jgi:MFS transporter, MFS domain-containing protein family, molybdate-anion transporter
MFDTFYSYSAKWPSWNLHLLFGLIFLALILKELHKRLQSKEANNINRNSLKYDKSAFLSFQRTYLLVFYVTQLADWLQGPTMWELYNEYTSDKKYTPSDFPLKECIANGPSSGYCHPAKWGQSFISTLFITGFATSSIASMFVGPLIDTYGRKLSCIVYCVLEVVINTMEHSTDMRILLLGRFLGGISTSILFVSFESWMVTEHRSRGFPDQLMSSTNAWAQIGNGILAVIAGILCQVMKDVFGPIGPFKLAIATTSTILALIFFTWNENYGNATTSLSSSFSDAWKYVIGSPTIICLGLTQALFEGAMYTFVFNYVPTLYRVGINSTGLVFSCLMVCVTIGGMLFEIFVGESAPRIFATKAALFTLYTFTIATLAFLMASLFSNNFYCILFSFCIFETTVGAAFASMATLRSQLLPQELQGTIMNIFRVPLNMLVVIGTKLDTWYEADIIFGTCAVLLLFASGFQTFVVLREGGGIKS